MNRVLKKLLSSTLSTCSSSSSSSSSSSLLHHTPRLYASTSAPPSPSSTAGGHHSGTPPDHHHSSSHHTDDHGHGHGHHEPEKRKNFEWRSQSGQNSPYENQGEDPNLLFQQEIPSRHNYQGHWGNEPIWLPYRTMTSALPLRFYHAALFISMMVWFYVFHRAFSEPAYMTGHAYVPDVSKFTDEELGIPPDDAD